VEKLGTGTTTTCLGGLKTSEALVAMELSLILLFSLKINFGGGGNGRRLAEKLVKQLIML